MAATARVTPTHEHLVDRKALPDPAAKTAATINRHPAMRAFPAGPGAAGEASLGSWCPE